MDSELRRSGRIEGQEIREQTRKGKERERLPSPPDFAAGKRKRGILRQEDIEQAPWQKKIKLDNSSVKDKCKIIFKSAHRKMHALYKHLKEDLGEENFAKRVGFSKKDIDPLMNIFTSLRKQETITDEDLKKFLGATESLIDKLEILENNAEEEEKLSDSLKKELEKLRPRQSELSDLTSLTSSDKLDLSSITISREDFAKIQNTIITKATANLDSISSTSDINVENRKKAVRLIREARDEKGLDGGYAKYEAVLHLAQEDPSIYHMMERIYTEHSNNTDTSDIARITLIKEYFAKIQNTIITKASGTLSKTSRSSEVNVENREKAVRLIREARDEKGLDGGYAKYEAVLQLAQEDLPIYRMMERIYTEHSNNTDTSDIARITLTKEYFAKIQNTIITKASGKLDSISSNSEVNVENRKKAVRLIREARNEKGLDGGYAKYEAVLQLAQEDPSIYHMMERIYLSRNVS
jgi:hypothetical protein